MPSDDALRDGLSDGDRRSHANDVDVVVVGGGDGTLLAAIDGLIETKLPLAVLPLGTFNELARTLGIPADLEAAAALVDDGRAVPDSTSAASTACTIFNEASIGLSTRVTRLQTGEVKRRSGCSRFRLRRCARCAGRVRCTSRSKRRTARSGACARCS